MTVAVIDSGGANVGSVLQALARLGAEASLTQSVEVIQRASHVILPGVGTAQAAMAVLSEQGLVRVIQALTQPVLGICLGLQLLYRSSEEGGQSTPCLGVIDGQVKRLGVPDDLRLPHMGWNQMTWVQDDPIASAVNTDDWFYFVHSYGIDADHPSVIARCEHGVAFGAMVRHNNFLACQFHPEKSAKAGQQLIQAFLST